MCVGNKVEGVRDYKLTTMERKVLAPCNGSVSCIPLRNDQQRKHIGCGINIGGGRNYGVPPGGTDMRSRTLEA